MFDWAVKSPLRELYLSISQSLIIIFFLCTSPVMYYQDYGSWDWSAFNEPLWVWRRSVDFRLWFSLQGFCVLYFILSEFLTKDVLKCIINATYLIGCWNSTLINLVLKTFLLIFNTIHKMGCCEYCYWLRWSTIRRVKSGSLKYPFLGQQLMVGIICIFVCNFMIHWQSFWKEEKYL